MTTLTYPIAIEPGTRTTAWGVVVPDLPGCFSAGDTLDEALAHAREAIEAWVDAVIEDGGEVPAPSSVDLHYGNPDFAGWIWALVEIDPLRLDQAVERVNITLPRRVLSRLDALAKARGESRSGLIARLAMEASR
jgi:predicted RNase H-like HicB family nuclease